MKEITIKVAPFNPKKLKIGMLVLYNNQLLQITAWHDEEDKWYLGTEFVTNALEPEFYPDGKTRVFQPVYIVTI